MYTLALAYFAVAGQSSIKLQFLPPVGRTYHFAMKSNTVMDTPIGAPQGGGKPSNLMMVIPIDMKIVKRVGDVTTMESRTGKPTVSGSMAAFMGNRLGSLQNAKAVQSQVDKHFHVVSMSGAASPMAGALGNLTFPDHPVRVGESWKTSIDMGKLMGPMAGGGSSAGSGKIPITYRLVGIRHDGGKSIAVLAVILNAKIPVMGMEMNMDGTGTATIDVATGMFETSTMKAVIGASVQGKSFKMHMDQSLSRS